MNVSDASWMQNPNVRFALAVAIAATVAINTVDELSVKAIVGIIGACLVTAKAFMSDPNQQPKPPTATASESVTTTVEVTLPKQAGGDVTKLDLK